MHFEPWVKFILVTGGMAATAGAVFYGIGLFVSIFKHSTGSAGEEEN